MKFLLNMNLSRQLGRLLETEGHGWRHLRDLGLARAQDREVLALAKASGEVILTHDLDYGHLLAFSGDIRALCRNFPAAQRSPLSPLRDHEKELAGMGASS